MLSKELVFIPVAVASVMTGTHYSVQLTHVTSEILPFLI